MDFTNLIKVNEVKLYKVAKAILTNEDDVCDALQEAYLSAYSNLNTLKNEKYFVTWITRILINQCYSIISKNRIHSIKITKAQSQLTYTEETEFEDIIDNQIVQKALDLLDEDLRLIAVMYYYNDMSVKDISKTVNIPAGTVKSRLKRARDRLYDILKQMEVGI